MSLKKSEILAQLFKDYGLFFDPKDKNSKDNDVFEHPHYKIISRSGIEKIQKSAGIKIHYDVVYADADTMVIKATGSRGEEVIETFASASGATSKNAYYAEMAEKRAMSRVVLKLAGLYEYGVFGADEADEFSDFVKGSRSTNVARVK
jgi:hypothetical protein